MRQQDEMVSPTIDPQQTIPDMDQSLGTQNFKYNKQSKLINHIKQTTNNKLTKTKTKIMAKFIKFRIDNAQRINRWIRTKRCIIRRFKN